MQDDMRIGLIGCGNISASYLSRAALFRGVRFRAVADINPAAAEARAREYGIEAMSTEALLAHPEVDLVLNLTVPAAHYELARRALMAGKHVYSEKPYVLSVDEGRALQALADARGLRLGSAPDTFLGGTPQLARHLIDSGRLGRITSGRALFQSRGMEHWHPNPDFFFLKGGGPVLDLGPYHIANLVQLIGPVRRVSAHCATPSPTRTIGSEPRRGEVIPVETPTTIHATLDFVQGAVVTLMTSWDVWTPDRPSAVLHGETGSLDLPDPNFFGGALRLTRGNEPAELPDWPHPLGIDNRDAPGRRVADYRMAGLSDMAMAIAEGRPHRCDGAFALHVVEVMTAILQSGEEGRFIDIETRCTRPAPLDPAAARALMREEGTP